MGVDELLSSLRGHQQEQLGEIRQETEAREAELRKKADDEVAAIKTDYEYRLAAASAKEEEAVQHQLRNCKRQLLLQAEQRLAGRLKKEAEQQLNRLRDGEYDLVFKKLVAELPGKKWDTAQVNPEDIDIVQACLPQVAVEPDTTITGGLVVTAEQGGVLVDNSFAKRLKNIWPLLLPEMIGEIYREMRENAAAQASTAE